MLDLKILVQECGVNLYDVELVNENKRTIYRVYITKSGGVSLEDCEKVSRVLSPIFDVEPPVDGDYNLEVSSPGLERVLTRAEHFINATGEKVAITLIGNNKLKGEIVGFVDDILTIKTEDENLEIKFNDIKRAKTYIEW
ncbi:MAG: ribosome maturation factor RimP [Campylobacter sp.]|nr:ribosome maturation factor RimP [Campylobacter sp.]